MQTLEASRALNVVQARILEESVGEKEFVEAREKAKVSIERMLSGVREFDDGFPLDIVYDEDGHPRPAIPIAYNQLQPETVPVDDAYAPFPGLAPPVG